MIENFNISTFNEGEKFKVYFGEDYGELTLDKIKKGKFNMPTAFREPFILLFKGTKAITFSQGQYRMVNERIGEFELFITPVVAPNGDQECFYYEAVIS